MKRLACLVIAVALATCSGAPRPAPPPPPAPAPRLAAASLPSLERWRRHLAEDLMPYWTTPDALGTPLGNFPTFRCADGSAYRAASPCPEAASAPPWIAASGIETDGAGFIAVNALLQSVSHPDIFAAGDVASMTGLRIPKSGVYAVRQGPPLAANLRQALASMSLIPYVPQPTALALISAGDKYAVASYGRIAFEGAWVWRWKDFIDRRFMNRYHIATPAKQQSGTSA